MVHLSRRTLLKSSAAAGGAVVASNWLPDAPGSTTPVEIASRAPVEDSVPTTCWIGAQDCGMTARRIDGRVVKLDGAPGFPQNAGTLCQKGQAQLASVYDPHRVKTPLIRTNGKGRTGEWRAAPWDEALDLVAAAYAEVAADDPSLVVWQKGRSKSKELYDRAFVEAIGATKLNHGSFCTSTAQRAVEYTIGLHGVLHPDLPNSKYVLSWGWNLTGAGGNKSCWITWPRQLVGARERNGLRIVHIDPRLRPAGPFADEWVPIRPAGDLALALAICHELIAQGFVDREYLTRFTNAAHLVGDDGRILMVPGRRRGGRDVTAVWDEASDAVVAADDARRPALDGEFRIGGERYATAYRRLAEHLDQYTPDWAADRSGIDASTIRRLANEFGSNAEIGSTTVVDGIEVPSRPVGIMAYHSVTQSLGFQTVRAMSMISMLVGAWGAVGGQMADHDWTIHQHFSGFEDIEVDEPPYDFTLKHSKYFPLTSGSPAVLARLMQDPNRYEVERIPRMAILHMVNPVVSFTSQPDVMRAYDRFEFVAVVSPWMSETADLFADVVLPAATIEKYEGPLDVGDGVVDATALRLPPMEPLFESRGEFDIYLDLAERMGRLGGPGGYVDRVNDELGLTDSGWALDLDARPPVRDVFDRWAKAHGLSGIDYFEQHGVWVRGPVPPTRRYGYVTDPPFGGAVHRLYGESLAVAQQRQRELGSPEIYWRDYTAFPTWRDPTMTGSPAEYEFTLISYKLAEHKQSRTSMNPLLTELSSGQRLEMNPAAARRLGLHDGDDVVVESHHALTGETRRIETVLSLTEGIRPDVVGMPHHFGTWAHPVAAGRGPTPNELFFADEGYVDQAGGASFHVRVKVTKAEGS